MDGSTLLRRIFAGISLISVIFLICLTGTSIYAHFTRTCRGDFPRPPSAGETPHSLPQRTPPSMLAPDIPPDGPDAIPTEFVFEIPPAHYSQYLSEIPYTFQNWTGADVLVVPIPTLYSIDADGTSVRIELAPSDEPIGFCGTPDYIAAGVFSARTLPVSMLYEPLKPGLYRLDFDVVSEDYSAVDVISAEFTVV